MKGKLIRDKYRILTTLGQNAFSETFLTIDHRWFCNRRYIIKKFRPILGNPEVENMRRLFYQEASILKRLSGHNPQIPRLYEYFVDGEDFYLVREWIDGLTLKQKVEQQGRLSSQEAEHILNSVLSVLKYIHGYGIVYRQLKPSTIILRQNPWLAESYKSCLPTPIYFGGVKELEIKIDHSRQHSSVVAHQQEYIPPEQEQGKSVFASDLYSLGLTTIYLLTGKNPLEFPLDPRTKQLQWHQEVPDLQINLVRVLDRAICPDIRERFSTAEEMLQSLNSSTINLSTPVFEQPVTKFKLNSELKIISLLSSLGIGLVGLVFILLNVDFAGLMNNDVNRPYGDISPENLSTETSINNLEFSPDESLTTTKIPAFPLGMSQQNIAELLGEPTQTDQGYWPNSQALIYEGIVSKAIALGFLTDTKTTNVRQAEISFGDSVDLKTIKLHSQELLQKYYSPEIEHQINQIYLKASDRHYFEFTDLEGVVQRNPQEHIYIAIWDREFH